MYRFIRQYGANIGGFLFLIGSVILFIGGASDFSNFLSLNTITGFILTAASLVFLGFGHYLWGIVAGQSLGTIGYALIILKFFLLGQWDGMIGGFFSMSVNFWTALKAYLRNKAIITEDPKEDTDNTYPFLIPMGFQALGNSFQAWGFWQNDLLLNMGVACIWISAAIFIALSNPKATKDIS